MALIDGLPPFNVPPQPPLLLASNLWKIALGLMAANLSAFTLSVIKGEGELLMYQMIKNSLVLLASTYGFFLMPKCFLERQIDRQQIVVVSKAAIFFALLSAQLTPLQYLVCGKL